MSYNPKDPKDIHSKPTSDVSVQKPNSGAKKSAGNHIDSAESTTPPTERVNNTSKRQDYNPKHQTPEHLQDKKSNKDQVTNKEEDLDSNTPQNSTSGYKQDKYADQNIKSNPNRKTTEVDDDEELMDDEIEPVIDETGDSPIYDEDEDDSSSKRKGSERSHAKSETH